MGGPQSFLLDLELRWTTSHTAASFCHPPTPRTQPRVLAFLKLLPIFLVSQYLLVSPDPFSNRPLPIVFSANTPKTPFVLRAFLLITKLKSLIHRMKQSCLGFQRNFPPCLRSPSSGLPMVFSSLSVEIKEVSGIYFGSGPVLIMILHPLSCLMTTRSQGCTFPTCLQIRKQAQKVK